MNRTYRGGAVTPDPSLFTAVMEGQWEVVREKVSASTHELLHRTCPAIYSPNRRSFRLPNKNLTEPPHHLPLSSQLLSLATTAAIMTAVAIAVSMVLFFLSLTLVVVFRILVVPTTPASTRRELVLDYVSQSPTAVSSFLGAKEAKALALYDNPKLITDAALASSRVLTPGQRFDVSVSLSLPETRHNVDAGVFQVRAELLTARGEVIANATRPAMLGHTGSEVRLLRLLVSWPLHALGLVEEARTATLPMFEGITERQTRPFAGVRVTVVPRAGGGPEAVPQVWRAHADVRMDMSALTRFLYHYPASSFAVMVLVTWGYLCAAALLVFAAAAAAGVVRVPTSFAGEVVRRASAGEIGKRPDPFFDGMGLTTSSDDEAHSGLGTPSRLSGDSEGDTTNQGEGLKAQTGARHRRVNLSENNVRVYFSVISPRPPRSPPWPPSCALRIRQSNKATRPPGRTRACHSRFAWRTPAPGSTCRA